MWGKILRYAVLSAALVVFMCKPFKRYGKGDVREVVVFLDERDRLLPVLAQVLADTFYTPHPEPRFRLLVPPLDSLTPYMGYRNTLLIAAPGMKTWPLYQKIFKATPGLTFQRGVIYEDDHWIGIGAEQWGALESLLQSALPVVQESLQSWAEQSYREREYFTGHNKKIRNVIRERWHLDLDIPAGWAFFAQDTNFFALAKHYPDRFFFIYRESFTRPLEPQAILDLRDQLTKVYYQGDYVDRSHVRVEKTTFLGYPAVRIYGVWQNDSLYIGGPFLLYAFNRDHRAFYLLDMAVFAPEKDYKLSYLWRTEVILKTLKFLE